MIDFVVTEVDGDNIIRFDTQFGSHNGGYVNSECLWFTNLAMADFERKSAIHLYRRVS